MLGNARRRPAVDLAAFLDGVINTAMLAHFFSGFNKAGRIINADDFVAYFGKFKSRSADCTSNV